MCLPTTTARKPFSPRGLALAKTLDNLSLISKRAQEDYWVCLEQTREALRFIKIMRAIFTLAADRQKDASSLKIMRAIFTLAADRQKDDFLLFYLAGDVGMGKTIEAGLIMMELIARRAALFSGVCSLMDSVCV